MYLQTTHSSGAEEWYCERCGRRLLLTWPPNYKRLVMEAGDEYAIHSGAKNGMKILGLEVTPEVEDELSEELRAALEEAFKRIDLDD